MALSGEFDIELSLLLEAIHLDDAAHSAMPDAAIALCPGARVLSAKGISQWVQQLSTWQNPGRRSAQ
jgi:hypothetical protein